MIEFFFVDIYILYPSHIEVCKNNCFNFNSFSERDKALLFNLYLVSKNSIYLQELL